MAASLERQRTSVQKQVSGSQPTASSSFFTTPFPDAASVAPAYECEPMDKGELEKIVQTASDREGLSAALVQAVIGKESASKPCAVSPKGAQGLMQLMPATADILGVKDPFDARQNVDGGAHLLKQLLSKYNGDVSLALGAYNAGSGRVDREGGVPAIPETLNYVSDILSRLKAE